VAGKEQRNGPPQRPGGLKITETVHSLGAWQEHGGLRSVLAGTKRSILDGRFARYPKETDRSQAVSASLDPFGIKVKMTRRDFEEVLAQCGMANTVRKPVIRGLRAREAGAAIAACAALPRTEQAVQLPVCSAWLAATPQLLLPNV